MKRFDKIASFSAAAFPVGIFLSTGSSSFGSRTWNRLMQRSGSEAGQETMANAKICLSEITAFVVAERQVV